MAQFDVIAPPGARDARLDAEHVAADAYPEERFESRAVQPAGRAGVPGPAAAGRRGRHRIDIGGHGIGLELVTRHLSGAAAVTHGAEAVEQFLGAVTVAQARERHERPDATVGVLAAVLTDAGRIGAHVAWVGLGAHERRGEEQQLLLLGPYQLLDD